MAAGVCLLGLVWASLGFFPYERDVFALCGEIPERGAYTTTVVAWPPGATRCVVTLPSRRQREMVTVPWGAWASVVLLAAAAWLATLAALGAGRRAPLAWSSAGMVLAAAIVWFL